MYLYLDYETFSLLDLKEVGLDNYAKHPSTGISMLGWSLDKEEVEIWLPHLGPPPKKLLDALRDPSIIKIAWNSSFEFNITLRIFGPRYTDGLNVPITEFRDPIILAHNISLPGKLEVVAQILKMKHQKDPRGDELKFMFCQPVSLGGEMTLFGMTTPLFRDHKSHPKEFQEYIEYCKQDVRAERDLWYRLLKIPFPERDWQGWLLDQKINTFGMPGRRDLGEKGLRLALRFINDQRKLLKELTGLENPNSDVQMKAWITPRGYPWNSLRAPTVTAEINNPESKITPECRVALKVRSSARKSSYTKIEKFLSLLSTEDDRLRNQFRYMGAARTGRWASGGGEDASMQVQNLPRGEKAVKKKLMLALDLLNKEDYDGIVKEFTNTKNPKDSLTVVEFIITLLRSLFQAKSGKKFIVADLNAIENRVLGWMAGCDAILDVFRHSKEEGGDPYLAFGTKMYKKTYAEMWADYKAGKEDERQNSKPAVLGAGYGLGGGEMFINEYGDEVRGGLWGYAKNVCGVDMPKELAHESVKIFRDSYPEVVQMWTDFEEAFKQVLKRGGVIKVGEVTWNRQEREWVAHPTKGKQCVLIFSRKKMEDGGYLMRMQLPSGRALHYLNATIEEENRVSKKTGRPYTTQTIYYDGIEHSATQDVDGKNVKKRHKWGRVKTYGGKLCLDAETPVITDSGIIPLYLVASRDKVWDGYAWVSHGGVVCNGEKGTRSWMGLTGTPNHQILAGSEWLELGKITSRSGLCSLLTGLASAIRLWFSLNQENMVALGCGAIVDKYLMSVQEPCVEGTSPIALLADARKAERTKPNDSATTSSWTETFAKCGCVNCQTSYLAATTPTVPRIQTTGSEALVAMSHGEEIEVFGWNTLSHFLVGLTQLLNLIELTTTAIMNQEISGSYLAQKIQTIVEQLSGLPMMEKNFPTKSFGSDILRCGVKTLSTIISSVDAAFNGVSTDTTKQKVYDLLNCGHRHQFTIMTDAGPVVVHNCENADQAISRDIFLNGLLLADEMGFDLWGLFHDEAASEVDDSVFGLRLDDLIWCLVQIPNWAPGLLLGAEGYESLVYKKG